MKFITILLTYMFYINAEKYDSSGNCTENILPIEKTIQLAKEYNITIIFKNSTDNNDNNDNDTIILGLYDTDNLHIILYDVPKLEFFSKTNHGTLKHELIHAVQHCKGKRKRFIHLMDTRSFVNCLIQDSINATFIKNFYSDNNLLIEIEAYCLEKIITYENINDMLTIYCKQYKSNQM